jgi:hypothetical protein
MIRPKNGVQHPDLDQAWAKYDEQIEVAVKAVEQAIERELNAAAATGDLDAALKWKTANEQFQREGTIPDGLDGRRAGERPRPKQAKPILRALPLIAEAREQLAEAYRSAVKSLTKEHDFKRAEAVRAELDSLASGSNTLRNLLLDCDTARDAMSGRWNRVEAGIQSDAAGPAKLKLRVEELPQEYDFEVEFTPLNGDLCVQQGLSAFGAGFGCEFGGWGNQVVAFQLVDGRIGIENRTATRRRVWLTAGRRHASAIQVRKNSVTALLDGAHVVTLPTNFRNLRHRDDWALPPGVIGIGSWGTPTVFHRATIRPVVDSVAK